jgi:hypothetical protein
MTEMSMEKWSIGFQIVYSKEHLNRKGIRTAFYRFSIDGAVHQLSAYGVNTALVRRCPAVRRFAGEERGQEKR